MKVDLYTLCWNEIKIIPFVIDYWKNIKEQVDEFHVYIYDNGSDDGSVEELRKYGYYVKKILILELLNKI